jgi:hypothetical protein
MFLCSLFVPGPMRRSTEVDQMGKGKFKLE